VLEVGTLGGYSTIHLARAVPTDGRVTTLEIDPRHADVARTSLDAAGVGDRVDVLVGAALDTLPTLAAPYDLVFIDADKQNNAAYVRAALALSRPGTVIVVDNVVRDGAVADPADRTPTVRGVREVVDLVAAEPRLDATALQTVGAKGWDGFLLALVTD
jgi:predicted O-methyltransferase YrrM